MLQVEYFLQRPFPKARFYFRALEKNTAHQLNWAVKKPFFTQRNPESYSAAYCSVISFADPAHTILPLFLLKLICSFSLYKLWAVKMNSFNRFTHKRSRVLCFRLKKICLKLLLYFKSVISIYLHISDFILMFRTVYGWLYFIRFFTTDPAPRLTDD